MSIYVTNNSDKPLKDGFAGIQYEFKVGETVEIPLDAAQHIFGYGKKDKLPTITRLGWAKTMNELEEALARLAQWELSENPPKENHVLSPVVDKVPLPKKAGGKVLKAV